MFRKYNRIIFRIIKRNWAFTFINVSGLAIGLAAFILIMLWVTDELNYDKFNTNFKNIYRIVENQHYAGGQIFPVAVTPGPLASKIKDEYPEIKKASRLTVNWYIVKYGEKKFYEEFTLVDPDFFDIFSVELIKGDKSNVISNPYSVILTEELANKYFGHENPMGKVININKGEFVVTGIMKNFPKNSHYQVKSIIPFLYLKTIGSLDEKWFNNGYYTYIKIDPHTNVSNFNKKIKNFIDRHNKGGPDVYAQPIGDIHLYCSGKFAAEIWAQGDIRYVKSLSLVAFFILFIACINFMNLSTAQSVKRAKEVGMLKVSGSSKTKLVLQFLVESVLLVLISYFIAIAIVENLLPIFNNLTGKEFIIHYFSIHILINSLVIIILTGLLAGCYPAFILSSFNPVKVLKGTFQSGKSAATFRKVLVTAQFAISIILIIGTLVIYRQLTYIQHKKLGYDHENIVYFYIGDNIKSHFQSFKQELLATTGIEGISATNQFLTNVQSSTDYWTWEGKNNTDKILIHNIAVDEDFQKTFKSEMAQGTFYSHDQFLDTSSIVINQTAARLINPKTQVVGKILTFGGDNYSIIGVMKDFHFMSVHNKIEPLILYYQPKNYITYVRIARGNYDQSLKNIKKIYNKFAPDQPSPYIWFLDEELNKLYASEKRMGDLFRYFTGLAILISCLGLFGLSLFTAEQKTKEIGIRKTFGESVLSINRLLLKQYFYWIAIATIFAVPITWYIMQMWLNNFSYRIELHPVDFIIAPVISLLVAIITVGYQSFKAATSNPAEALKYE